MTEPNNTKQIVEERQLSQWHLLVASLLASLGQKGSNQGTLNLIMARSMNDFIVPFFESREDAEKLRAEIAKTDDLKAQMNAVVEYVNGIFALAGTISVEDTGESNKKVVKIKSGSCRFCPVGVGRAEIPPNTTFCPIPSMLEKSINHFREGKPPVKLFLVREKAFTKVLEKKDGNCYITYVTG